MTDRPDPPIDDALADAATPVSRDLFRIDTSLMTNPVVVRAVFGIAIGFAVLIWPDRTDRVLFRLIGLGFVAVGATLAWTARRERDHRAVVVGVAQIIAGILLIASVVRARRRRVP